MATIPTTKVPERVLNILQGLFHYELLRGIHITTPTELPGFSVIDGNIPHAQNSDFREDTLPDVATIKTLYLAMPQTTNAIIYHFVNGVVEIYECAPGQVIYSVRDDEGKATAGYMGDLLALEFYDMTVDIVHPLLGIDIRSFKSEGASPLFRKVEEQVEEEKGDDGLWLSSLNTIDLLLQKHVQSVAQMREGPLSPEGLYTLGESLQDLTRLVINLAGINGNISMLDRRVNQGEAGEPDIMEVIHAGKILDDRRSSPEDVAKAREVLQRTSIDLSTLDQATLYDLTFKHATSLRTGSGMGDLGPLHGPYQRSHNRDRDYRGRDGRDRFERELDNRIANSHRYRQR